ncbi:TRAP transporter small permease [Bacillus sp. FJAT-27251]|uniref:TRAP transporter small permease n=1 Tax=Bacillus sp. FJAT-27251 TaxID=1684142 RepID=UPI0006A7AAC0|nr:TRAP transporter small permease [Bacillus sp. FJAT-27251]
MKWFNAIDDVISTIALLVIILLTGINVLMRFVFSNPIPWAEEVTIGMFIWLVFIGVSSAMKREGHIGVDYFVNKMPKPLRLISELVRVAAMYYVLIFVFVILGYQLTSQAVNKVTPVLAISYQFIDMAVPIGGLLTAIHFTRILLKSHRKNSEELGGS